MIIYDQQFVTINFQGPCDSFLNGGQFLQRRVVLLGTREASQRAKAHEFQASRSAAARVE